MEETQGKTPIRGGFRCSGEGTGRVGTEEIIMRAIENVRNDAIQPAQVRLEEAAIAILIERIARLDQEDKDDLIAVLIEVQRCTTAAELKEVEQTIRELIFPELAGELVIGEAGNARGDSKLQAWSEKIGATIKQLRLDRGWTQEQLAERAGLPQPHICRLERGQHSPSHKTIVALASAFEIEAKAIDPSMDDE
jgi:DNA-binding XRE family transcriptional regulator